MMSTVPNQPTLRETFLAWQCRIRQMAMRDSEGRPMPGMTPEVIIGEQSFGAMVALMIKQHPYSVTPEFQHMARSTQDPRQRREKALKFLSSAYYQRSRDFSDELTALFVIGSPTAAALLEAGICRLAFSQYNQNFDLTCAVRTLSQTEYGFQTTFWHNSLFNAAMPIDVQVLGFQPDWDQSSGAA